MRAMMSDLLEDEGYRVDSAGSAEDALRLFRDRRYDLLVTDYRLPGHSGAWLLREAIGRRLITGASTLLVTSEPDALDLRGRSDVVAKPLDLDLFLPQIRAMLTRALRPPRTTALEDPRVELILYVSAESLACRRAEQTLHDVLARFDARQINWRVSDIAADPDAAARDHVLFTPTLIKRAPEPQLWVLGELTPRVTVDVLLMSGLIPATTS